MYRYGHSAGDRLLTQKYNVWRHIATSYNIPNGGIAKDGIYACPSSSKLSSYI